MTNESNGRPVSEFEKALLSLESIVERMQREQMDLDAMVKLYEEGIGYLETCQKVLEEAEFKIKQLNSRLKVEQAEGSENG